jgi:hypothetical protein
MLIHVTMGDALDRLTILDIKLQRILDEDKIQMIKNTRINLMNCIKNFEEYDYRILKLINTELYNAEEKVYNGSDNIEDYKIIKTWNTMRVNIKKYIDNKTLSDMIEQKGYKKKIGIFIGHMGYGDVLLLNGAIRYCSFKVDELYLVEAANNIKNIQLIFNDIQNLKIITEQEIDMIEKQITDDIIYFKSGLHLNKNCLQNPNYNITTDFYKELNIPKNIMFDFFYIPQYIETLKPPKTDYIFVQTKSSSHDNKAIISWNINDILTIDSNTNLYSTTDLFFDTANNFINKPIAYYVDLLRNAKEIHVVDSCFACFVFSMNLKNVIYYNRNNVKISNIFTN